jgi:hypothetical protein
MRYKIIDIKNITTMSENKNRAYVELYGAPLPPRKDDRISRVLSTGSADIDDLLKTAALHCTHFDRAVISHIRFENICIEEGRTVKSVSCRVRRATDSVLCENPRCNVQSYDATKVRMNYQSYKF